MLCHKPSLVILSAAKDPRPKAEKEKNRQKNFKHQQVGKVFADQVGMFGEVSAVKISNAKIVKDLEKPGKVEQDKIETIFSCWEDILYGSVDTKNIQRLDEHVDSDEK